MTANIPDLFVEEDDKHSWSETLSVYRNEIRRFLYENDTKKLEETVDEQIELWLSEAESKSFGYAKLNASEKELVITHIEKIRLLIDESSLSQSKKIKLFNRLSSLYNEILRDNTKTDDFFAFMGDLAFTVGEMAQKAKPAIDEFKAIMRIVMGGRARKEGVLLPTEDDLPQLPAPEHSEGE
ncbi:MULTISPECIES: hypothetical protein [unclassified Xanthobacter]|uniref:hypothetical protein n=1 Tax=unclassified Xanthobacter TaxID=2623496 RepID=UPI001EDE871F|nr:MULTISPECIES: hypothetical protein [unclassified Xanthobacter]